MKIQGAIMKQKYEIKMSPCRVNFFFLKAGHVTCRAVTCAVAEKHAL